MQVLRKTTKTRFKRKNNEGIMNRIKENRTFSYNSQKGRKFDWTYVLYITVLEGQ